MTALVALAEAAGSGGGLTALGIVVGRLTTRPRTPKPPKQVCSCYHGRGMHNADGCHFTESEQVKVKDKSTYTKNQFGEKVLSQADIEWQVVEERCGCKKYDGPIPAEEFILNNYV